MLGFTTVIAVRDGRALWRRSGAARDIGGIAIDHAAERRPGCAATHPPVAYLVSTQVALSLVVLAGAGLFVRTLQNLQQLDPGFSSEGVLVVEIDGQSPAFLQQLVADVQRMPNVLSASLTTHTPLNGSLWSEPIVRAGEPLPERDTAFAVAAGPHFFATMQTRFGPDATSTTAIHRPVSR